MSRIYLTSNTTFYVDPVTGNDANDGSAAHPWKTIQFACNYLRASIDCAGRDVTIQLADGTYTEFVTVASSLVGHHLFTIRGNPANPGAVQWTPSVAGSILSATDYGCVMLDGIEFGFYASGPTCVCISAFQFGIIDFQNCLFASCTDGTHIMASNMGSINVLGPYTLIGNARYHIQADGGGINLGNCSVNCAIPMAFSDFCYVTNRGSVAVGGQPYSGPGAGSWTQGTKYAVTMNGVLKVGSTVFPGTSPGVTASGGQAQ